MSVKKLSNFEGKPTYAQHNFDLAILCKTTKKAHTKNLSMIGQAVWPQFAILYTQRPWRFFDFLNISGMEHSRWKMLTAFNYSLKNSAFEPKKFPLLIKIVNVKILPDWQKQSNFEGKLNLADFYFDLAILCKTTKKAHTKKLSIIGQVVWPQFAILCTRRPWRFFNFLNISGMEHSRWKILMAFHYSFKKSAFEPPKLTL